MGKTRDILGHVFVDVAKRKRKCHHKSKEHAIVEGQRCLVIRESDGLGHKNYCVQCAHEILEAASQKLSKLAMEVGSPMSTRRKPA